MTSPIGVETIEKDRDVVQVHAQRLQLSRGLYRFARSLRQVGLITAIGQAGLRVILVVEIQHP